MKDRIKISKQVIKETFNIEQMLTSIIEHSNEIFYLHDIHHKFLYVSPQSLKILGYTPDEMMVEWIRFISDNPINKIGYEITEKALATGQRQKPYLLEVLKKDGRKVLLEIEESPLKDVKGKVIGIVGAARDVTERKKAEESLKELNIRFRTLINAIPDIVFFKDVQGRHLIINKATEEFHGVPQKDIIGETCEAFLPMDLAEQCMKSDKEVLERRRPFRSEERSIRKNGNAIFLDTFKVPLYDESDKPIGLVGISRDITDRKKAEQALQQREKDLAVQAENLEETNTALKVLLKKRDEDRIELEEKVLLNIKELVVPYLEKLRKCGLDERQSAYAGILESNLHDIISSFSYRLSFTYLNFTPSEIKVANLVKQGKTNKEIAEVLNFSSRTAAFHRERIRKKLGLKNKKTNLRSYLSSIN